MLPTPKIICPICGGPNDCAPGQSGSELAVIINGKCHCGNIGLVLEWPEDAPLRIPARACGCSFCVKHGGVWTSNPRSALAVVIHDPSRLSKYAFGTRTAIFHL